MMSQIQAIEDVVKRPAYIDHVRTRALPNSYFADDQKTKGVFMGYDFHITNTGPKLIEINSNAGRAFIVNMIEESGASASGDFAAHILDMFRSEWKQSGREETLKTLAIVDENPASQYHYPDMCLAKSILEGRGIDVVITDPKDLDLRDGALFHGKLQIDVVYNRLTDFSFNAPEN
jgi:hypothetical protein